MINYLQVDEGIEAMLCCWLQQLQEFGGPDVGNVAALCAPQTTSGTSGGLTSGIASLLPGTTASGPLSQQSGNTSQDKPDLIKGSVGSLRALGALAGIQPPIMTSTKLASSSGSLTKNNCTSGDFRARYNVSVFKLVI